MFGIFPTFEDSLGAIGVQSDGIGTSSLGSLSPFVTLNRSTSDVLQASTQSIYERFVNLVARGRSMSVSDVEALAQGRVWIGSTAFEIGLVDALGDRQAAVERAAELANIGMPAVRELRPPIPPGQLLLEQLSESVIARSRGQISASAFAPLLRQVDADWQLVRALNDPRHLYALCGPCTAVRGNPFGPW